MQMRTHRQINRIVVGVAASSGRGAIVLDAKCTFGCSREWKSGMDCHRIAPERGWVVCVRLRSDTVARSEQVDRPRRA